MKNLWKITAIVAGAGFALALIGFALGGAGTGYYVDRTGIHLDSYEYTRITESNLQGVKSIDVECSFGDIELVQSDAYGFDIQSSRGEWTWEITGGTLTLRRKSEGKVRFINFGWSGFSRSDKVTVYVPEGAKLETLRLSADSGTITAGSIGADEIFIADSFGDVRLRDIVSGSLEIDLDSGNFTGENLMAEDMTYKNSFGDGTFKAVTAKTFVSDADSGKVDFSSCDLHDTKITSSFGKITADGLNTSKLTVLSDTGDIVLEGDLRGQTVVESSFGNVSLDLIGAKDEYSYDVETDFGNVRIDGQNAGDEQAAQITGAPNSLKIDVDSGDADIMFGQ